MGSKRKKSANRVNPSDLLPSAFVADPTNEEGIPLNKNKEQGGKSPLEESPPDKSGEGKSEGPEYGQTVVGALFPGIGETRAMDFLVSEGSTERPVHVDASMPILDVYKHDEEMISRYHQAREKLHVAHSFYPVDEECCCIFPCSLYCMLVPCIWAPTFFVRLCGCSPYADVRCSDHTNILAMTEHGVVGYDSKGSLGALAWSNVDIEGVGFSGSQSHKWCLSKNKPSRGPAELTCLLGVGLFNACCYISCCHHEIQDYYELTIPSTTRKRSSSDETEIAETASFPVGQHLNLHMKGLSSSKVPPESIVERMVALKAQAKVKASSNVGQTRSRSMPRAQVRSQVLLAIGEAESQARGHRSSAGLYKKMMDTRQATPTS